MWIYWNRWYMKKCTKFLKHLCSACVKWVHSREQEINTFILMKLVCTTYPTLVISFPCTCKKEIIKRLLSSDGSIFSNSSSSLLSSFVSNTEQSNGAVLWTRLPPSGWIHVSFLRFPSNRCSLSFNRKRFFSSRFRCVNSYWDEYEEREKKANK